MQISFNLYRKRDAKKWEAVGVVYRPIQRIDMPSDIGRSPVATAFLSEDVVPRKMFLNFADYHLLALLIDFRNEVDGTFVLDIMAIAKPVELYPPSPPCQFLHKLQAVFHRPAG
ncbi:MAG: hypothetical protein BWY40_00784 [bacterium ADurb.Bin270]|nr:MAG: hypothetical protein BWY40_00784 [bacterium ADurb.Bin270]